MSNRLTSHLRVWRRATVRAGARIPVMGRRALPILLEYVSVPVSKVVRLSVRAWAATTSVSCKYIDWLIQPGHAGAVMYVVATVVCVVFAVLTWALSLEPEQAFTDGTVSIGLLIIQTMSLVLGTSAVSIAGLIRRRILGLIIVGWLVSIAAFVTAYAGLYHAVGLAGGCAGVRDTIYFSIVTWTTLGYGDCQPTEPQRLLAGSQALLGLLSMSMLVGLVVALVTRDRPQREVTIARRARTLALKTRKHRPLRRS